MKQAHFLAALTTRRPSSWPVLISTLLFLLAACGPAEQNPQPAQMPDPGQPLPRPVAITNVTVVDAIGGEREDLTVVFTGDRITAILPGAARLANAEIIDGRGKYLIPGLWDFHVHLTYDKRLVEAMPELFLSWGITSVRDTGGLLHEVLPVVERMRAPGARAPRVYFAGPLLDGKFVVYDGDGRPEIGTQILNPEAAVAKVNELAEAGVDLVKVYEMVSPEVFDALVNTAEELELPIASHVPLAMRARNAGARVNSIEHLRNIEMDCANPEEFHAARLEVLSNPDGLPGATLRSTMHSMQRLPAIAAYDEAECDRVIAALEDTVQVPTLRLNSFVLSPPWQRDDWQSALSRLPEDIRADWTQQSIARSQQETGDTTFAEWSLFLTGRMFEAGVPFGAGTDTPINLSIPGYSLHSELEMLVRAGLTPLQAIEAATLVPAQFFGIDNELGSIAVGKRADLVLLDANPIEDISNTKAINTVISKGEVLSF